MSLCQALAGDSSLEQAFERELISLGLRLSWLGDDTDRFSYRDAWVILMEHHEQSPIRRALDPDSYAWGLTEQLLAEVYDNITALRYENAGGKGTKPKPLMRPGVKGYVPVRERKTEEEFVSPEQLRGDGEGRFTGDVMPASDLLRALGQEEYFLSIINKDA